MSHATQPARLPVAGRPQRARIPALINLTYAAALYLLFLAALGGAAGFFAGSGVPTGPHDAAPVAVAIGLLLLLLLLFAVQYTVMARPWFKRRRTRIVPEPAGRTSFVLAASPVLALLFWLWRPVRPVLWSLRDRAPARCGPPTRPGRAAAVRSTFLISHAGLSGMRQARLHARCVRYRPAPFTECGVYGRGRVRDHLLVSACDPPALAPASSARVLAMPRKRQEAGNMKHRTAIAMTAAARPAAGRRLIGVPEGRPVVLQDGSAVLIRPVRSTDAALLADGFARLSAASRQMRFLGVKKALSAAELRYFTDVDHHDHEALGALDRADGRGVGIARYIRDADDPQAGEIAVTIVDDWQGRGLGTELLAQLSDRARQEGIRRFTALADAGNVAVAALLRNAGARLVRHGRGTVEYEITLARGAGGSQAHVSRSAGQAAPGANSAAGSPGPERKCALPRGVPTGSYRARA